jgi:spermidine synthase
MFLFFLFFLISGFCSVLYELVWLRLSMAAFGVTTGMTSIVLSVFMGGLGLGSWAAGRFVREGRRASRVPPLLLYASIEMVIGIAALVVPYELHWGRALLQHMPGSSSLAYTLASGIAVTLALLPWCAAMGGTIPVGMLAIRDRLRNAGSRSFSYLYMANVTGALAGAVLPLFLIELNGFRGTLRIGAACNFLLAAVAAGIAAGRGAGAAAQNSEPSRGIVAIDPPVGDRRLLWLLFASGLSSLGMEVVWIRQFAPFLGTVVYAFAVILALYLAATSLGSLLYRQQSSKGQTSTTALWALLGLCALFPLWTADPRLHLANTMRVASGIVPFSALLGFITPMLVDRWSGGDPEHAGRAYAVNVLGCILGPLLSGFLLLPLLNERWALLLLAAPWLTLGVIDVLSHGSERASTAGMRTAKWFAYAAVAIAAGLFATSRSYEGQFPGSIALRDPTATVVASGTGWKRRLWVNGIGVTALTPVTKLMAHLPLTFLDHPPQRTLVICFGMGTTYRSLLSWDIPATAVELVPSVPRLFWYFHPDAPELLRSANSHVVIDDGRRYLERMPGPYDVITMDPPPPVEAAASSLLYSKEFYAAVRHSLRAGGILQTWLPSDADPVVRAAVARALVESFAYVRGFGSVEPIGFHFLASDRPIPERSAQELASRLPMKATADLLEWGPASTAEGQFAAVLGREFSPRDWIAREPGAPALVDDRPVNEYYVLRRGPLGEPGKR